MFFGFAEVLDTWYLFPPSQVIRDIPFPAKFVSAPAFGENAYFACFDVPTWFKKKYAAVWTQLMDAGETVEFTLSPPPPKTRLWGDRPPRSRQD